ncbi:MAG: C-terminal binding protein [Phycisphaeraceae bacterium]|nr:C-terminal binding protein [Phycisphaeraceae bacterium]
MTSPQSHVCIADFITGSLAPEQRVLGDGVRVVACDAHDESELWPAIDQVDAIMLYHNLTLSQATISRLHKCRLIVRCGVGYDNVDHAFARSRGIPVANVPDYGTEEVADSAIGLTLALTRGIHLLNSRLRRGEGPWMYHQARPAHRLRGRVFGIAGLGRIGGATAIRAKALGMDVAFVDPCLTDGVDKMLGVRRVESLDELAAQSFVLSLHCPLNDQTRRMLSADVLSRMTRGSYLINTARGDIVDPHALVAALADGRLAGAGIDVLNQEPPPADHPLVAAWRDPSHPAHDRLILNPHSAFYSEEGLMDMRIKGSEACRRALLGMTLRNVVN